MKTLRTMIIMMLILQCTAYAYDAGDNSDRLSSTSSSVFSPGYINAAKQKTESIRDQMYPQKSFMERLMENIKGGVADNVDKAANTKATPEIKKKTSAKITSTQASEVPVTTPVSLKPDEIPDYIRDEIQKYIDGLNNGYRSDYTLKQSNGKYYAFWKYSLTGIKAQTFDSSGIAIYETPIILTGGRSLNSASINSISILPNGNVAVFWDERDSAGKYFLKTQRFDSGGIAISETLTTVTGDGLLYAVYIDRISVLTNGSIAVFWKESGSNSRESIKVQMFNSGGIAIYETPISLTGSRSLFFADISNVSVLANGNVVVFWYERDSAGDKYSIRTQTFDSNGLAISGSTAILTGGRILNYAYIENVSVLPSGNVTVLWKEADLNYKYSLKIQTFDPSGVAIPGSLTPLTGGELLGNATLKNVSILPNGNLAVFWNETGSDGKPSLKTQTFDSNGITMPGSLTTLTSGRLLNNADINNVSMLPGGNIAVFWSECASNNKWSFRTQRFNSSGIAIAETLTNIAGDALIYSATIDKVSTLPNGNVVLFWMERDVNYNYSLKTQTFNSSGIAIPGALTTLTESRLLVDTSVYNISALPNGNVVVFWMERGLNYRYSLRTQTFNSSGATIPGSISTLTGARVLYEIYISSVSTLPNGNVCVFWWERDLSNKHSLRTQTFNSSGAAIPGSLTVITGNRICNYATISNISVFPNGNVSVFWWERNINGYEIRTQTFNSSGIAIPGALTTLTGGRSLNSASIGNVTTLPDGNVVVFWTESDSNSKWSFKTQRFDSSGVAIPETLTNLIGNRSLYETYISSLSILSTGGIAVFWYERDVNQKYSLKTQALGANGSVVSNDTLKPSLAPTSTSNLRQDLLPDTFLNSLKSNIFKNSSYGWELRSDFNNSSNNAVPEIFKSLLSSKGALATNMGRPTNEAELGRLITKALSSAIGVPSLTETQSNTPEMQVAMALANILKNPNEDQKIIIDAITKLLEDVSKIEGEAGKSEELTKAENDLLKMAAAVLFAQGVPDLLKEGDVENMKGMFKDLGASKDKALMDYKDSVKPYYNNIAKEIAANIAVLETKGMIKKNLTEEQLKKLEPREIDRILENIRKNNDKSFELEYILQQDSKYRKEYLNPSKKLMEDNMKLILGSFAKKISEALEEKK